MTEYQNFCYQREMKRFLALFQMTEKEILASYTNTFTDEDCSGSELMNRIYLLDAVEAYLEHTDPEKYVNYITKTENGDPLPWDFEQFFKPILYKALSWYHDKLIDQIQSQ